MADKLEKLVQKFQKDLPPQYHELLQQRLYLLVGKEILGNLESLPNRDHILGMVEKALLQIHGDLGRFRADLAEKSLGPSRILPAVANSLADIPDTVRLVLKVKKESGRARQEICGQPVIFASAPMHAALEKLLAASAEEDINLTAKAAKLAASQLADYFSSNGLPADARSRIETGFLLFKTLGWGQFRLLTTALPLQIAVEYSPTAEPGHLSAYSRGLLLGICGQSLFADLPELRNPWSYFSLREVSAEEATSRIIVEISELR